jgi:hypothetical protein
MDRHIKMNLRIKVCLIQCGNIDIMRLTVNHIGLKKRTVVLWHSADLRFASASSKKTHEKRFIIIIAASIVI